MWFRCMGWTLVPGRFLGNDRHKLRHTVVNICIAEKGGMVDGIFPRNPTTPVESKVFIVFRTFFDTWNILEWT